VSKLPAWYAVNVVNVSDPAN